MSLPVLNHVKSPLFHTLYVTLAGTANTYTATVSSLTSLPEGLPVAVKVNITNTGVSTLNINSLGAKAIKDSKGADLKAGALTASSICTLRYNGTNFILQGDGSDVSQGLKATAGNILNGQTAAVNGTIITGTMPNRTGVGYTPGTTNQYIAAGYYDGNSIVLGDSDLVASNIKNGVTIFGVTGTMPTVPAGSSMVWEGNIDIPPYSQGSITFPQAFHHVVLISGGNYYTVYPGGSGGPSWGWVFNYASNGTSATFNQHASDGQYINVLVKGYV